MTTTTTTPITATAEDRALKAKHAAMWASGDYATVVDDIVAPLGSILVETVDVQAGQRVLDVAAGTGSSAIPAAQRGAEVTATDLTPELVQIGRPCRTRTVTSTSCCPPSASCSPRTTSRRRTSSSASAVRAGRSGC